MIDIKGIELPSTSEEVMILCLLDIDEFGERLYNAYEAIAENWINNKDLEWFNKIEEKFADLIVLYLKEVPNRFDVRGCLRSEKGTHINVEYKHTSRYFAMTFWVDHKPDFKVISYLRTVIGEEDVYVI